MDKLVMEVKDYHSINEAKIEINKINVIGGVNGSGKSTLSRILYSFLKGNSTKRKEIILQSIVEDINRIMDSLNYDGNDYDLPNHLKIDDDYRYIKDTYNRILKISKKHDKYAKMKHFELINEIADCSNELLNKFKRNDVDVNKKIEEHNKNFIEFHEERIADFKNQLKDLHDDNEKDKINEKILLNQEMYDLDVINDPDCVFNEISINNDVLEKSIDTILKKDSERKYDDEAKEARATFFDFQMKSMRISGSNFNKLDIVSDILEEMLPYIPKSEKINFHDDKLSRVMAYRYPSGIEKDFPIDYDVANLKLSEDVEEYLKDYSEILSLQDMRYDFNLQDWLFKDCLEIKNTFTILDKDDIDLSFECHNYISEKEFLDYDVREKFFIDSSSPNENAYGYFFNNGLINGVYYVDNVSIFELNQDKLFFHNLFHVNEITEDLFGFKFRVDDNEPDRNIQIILEKIERIIQGRYDYMGDSFETDKIDNTDKNRLNSLLDNSNSEKNISTLNFDTPSGIKQIGTIQLLLLKNKLKKDGYLIIDEPEVNLHPDWQFKFAEILVLLAKDLNITIYINSHSPFFIEAIDAFTEFYDMQNEINYYLAEESQNEGKYDFTKIGSDELFKIYDNLGRPYDLIDQLRLQKHLGE